MGLTDPDDPYIDPETGILRNLVGARTRRELADAEADLTFARLAQLSDSPSGGRGDLQELCEVHRHLFQDIYEWAGMLRTIDISKPTGRGENFLLFSQIPQAAEFTARELTEESLLRGLDRANFVDRLAYHYDQLNYIHPFREGNGRAQRVLWNRVAAGAGWHLNWTRVTGEQNDSASRIAAEERDLMPLVAMFEVVVEAGAGNDTFLWAPGATAE